MEIRRQEGNVFFIDFFEIIFEFPFLTFSFLSNFILHTSSNHAYLCHKNIQNITQKTNNIRTIANINNLFILLHIHCILREKEYNFFVKKSQKFTDIISRLNFYNTLQNGKEFSKDSNFPDRCTFFTYRFFRSNPLEQCCSNMYERSSYQLREVTIFRAERN